jgi:hypothetical protein
MKVAAQLFLVILIGVSVVVYLGYGIAVLFTHQTLPQTIVPLLFGALVLAAVIWILVQGIKLLNSPPRPQP